MAAQENRELSGEEAAVQLTYLQNAYSQQYEMLTENISSYIMAHSAIQKNIDLLEKAHKLKNSSILVDADGGLLINAKVGEIDTVMTDVGAGFVVEKSVSEALDFYRKNLHASEEYLKTLVGEKEKLEKELFSVNYKLSVLQQMQQEAQSGKKQ